MSIKHLSLAVCALGVLAGCNGPNTQPSEFTERTQGQAPQQTYTLSGVITEMTPAGVVPVPGVLVEETTTLRATRTDDVGHYRMTGVIAQSANATVSASKRGYVTRLTVFATGADARVDMQIDRRPVYTLSGVISEITPTGSVGIKGVTVEFLSWVANDYYTEGAATTDEEGRYSLPGLWSGPEVFTGLWLTKAGFRIDPQLVPSCDGCFRTLTINGNTVLDIVLDRLPSAGTASGPPIGRRQR